MDKDQTPPGTPDPKVERIQPKPQAKKNFGSPVELVVPEQRIRASDGEGHLVKIIRALRGKLATETVVCEITVVIRKRGVYYKKPIYYDETPLEELLEAIALD